MSMELRWSDEDLEDVERTAILSGRIYERNRIMAILKKEQEIRKASSDWGVIGIVNLMMMIQEEELKYEDQSGQLFLVRDGRVYT